MTPYFDSNDSYADEVQLRMRPRLRSFISPVRFGYDINCDMTIRSTVYKKRFLKAKQQMDERLTQSLEKHPLSGSFIVENAGDSSASSPLPYPLPIGKSNFSLNRLSTLSVGVQSTADQSIFRLLSDGATPFIHLQIVEIASDCLSKSKEDQTNCAYFWDMSQRLEDKLNEAQEKTNADGFAYLSKHVRPLLIIVSRTARLIECLEFNPDEFHRLLEEAEGVAREHLGAGNARVPDLSQYIISKVGLDRDLLVNIDPEQLEAEAFPSLNASFDSSESRTPKWRKYSKPLCEDDFEVIRLISNDAYGAVYLVRKRETRQRFALKKMNKHTLVMRNQVQQVYAERDILTLPIIHLWFHSMTLLKGDNIFACSWNMLKEAIVLCCLKTLGRFHLTSGRFMWPFCDVAVERFNF